MSLRETVKIVQAKKKGWTMEDVAQSINYSRIHLSREMKKKSSPLEKLLKEKHADIFTGKMITYSNIPSFETKGTDEKEKKIQQQQQKIAQLENQVQQLMNLLAKALEKR